jgi:hypothetical protein
MIDSDPDPAIFNIDLQDASKKHWLLVYELKTNGKTFLLPSCLAVATSCLGQLRAAEDDCTA